MIEKINIGVLGCASIASRWVIPSMIELNDRFNLIGVASRNKKKANNFAAQFHTDSYYGYENLLDNRNLDAVYIPLPNALHAEWISKSLDRNIHVLVEKSQACTKEDVEALNGVAKDRRLVLIENFQFRFHCQLEKIQEIIKTGGLGEIRCIKSYFGFPPFPDKENIRYQKNLGGGALLDAGAYVIKISQLLMGYDIEVKAACLNFDDTMGLDIWGGGFLQQKNGHLFSEVAFGFDNFYQCCLEIWGTRGCLSTNRVFTAPPGMEPKILLATTDHEEVIKIPSDNHFKNMLKHFYTLVKEKKDLDKEYLHNINQARLINEFRQKANEQ